MNILFYLAIFTFIATTIGIIEVITGIRKINFLNTIPPLLDQTPPKVSIIIAALNEEKTIEPALSSILSLDYKKLEIIVINDRSTDGTKDVLDKMALKYTSLKILNISELPQGWIGKNHAHQYGANQATGEYLLFTDADVVMEKTTVTRVMNYLTKKKLDHVALFFDPVLSSNSNYGKNSQLSIDRSQLTISLTQQKQLIKLTEK